MKGDTCLKLWQELWRAPRSVLNSGVVCVVRIFLHLDIVRAYISFYISLVLCFFIIFYSRAATGLQTTKPRFLSFAHCTLVASYTVYSTASLIPYTLYSTYSKSNFTLLNNNYCTVCSIIRYFIVHMSKPRVYINLILTMEK